MTSYALIRAGSRRARLRVRIRVERFFWGRWVPLYVKLVVSQVSPLTALRRAGVPGLLVWLGIVMNTIHRRRRQILREVGA